MFLTAKWFAPGRLVHKLCDGKVVLLAQDLDHVHLRSTGYCFTIKTLHKF